MPLQRRLPKVGFTSRVKKFNAEVRLSELNSINSDVIDLQVLIANNIIPVFSKKVKLIKSGEIKKSVNLKGILVSPGAQALIEAAGGKVEA
jgi:large subunit ribosomal protein L15